MTVVRVVAAHQVVQATHPRPVTERDALGIAAGRAIDAALARHSHEFRVGRKPTLAAIERFAAGQLEEALAEGMVECDPPTRDRVLRQIADVLRAFRASPLFGLSRPRSRLVLIGGTAAFYAQPDYWDGKARFFEMKSYRAIPPPPDVQLQLELFQLAFPGFQGSLACFDRHSTPVETTILTLPELPEARKVAVLALARQVALEQGTEKVLEYMDNPKVSYPWSP